MWVVVILLALLWVAERQQRLREQTELRVYQDEVRRQVRELMDAYDIPEGQFPPILSR